MQSQPQLQWGKKHFISHFIVFGSVLITHVIDTMDVVWVKKQGQTTKCSGLIFANIVLFYAGMSFLRKGCFKILEKDNRFLFS